MGAGSAAGNAAGSDRPAGAAAGHPPLAGGDDSCRAGSITAVAWSPDGKLIAYGDWSGRIRLIDAETRRLVQLLPGHEGGVNCVAWSPDGAWLASGAWGDKAVRLWRPDGTRGPVLTGHKSAVVCVAWSPDGKRLASGGHWGDSTVRIWSVDGTPGPVLPHDTIIHCVAWSPDGHVLATTDSGKGLIRLWNTSDGTPLTTLGPLPQQVTALGLESGRQIPGVERRRLRQGTCRGMDLGCR